MLDVNCPSCVSTDVSKNGKSVDGAQRYLCKDETCDVKSFKLDYTYNGWKYGIDEAVIDARADALGIREIAKSLGLSKQKVQDTINRTEHQDECLCAGCEN